MNYIQQIDNTHIEMLSVRMNTQLWKIPIKSRKPMIKNNFQTSKPEKYIKFYPTTWSSNCLKQAGKMTLCDVVEENDYFSQLDKVNAQSQSLVIFRLRNNRKLVPVKQRISSEYEAVKKVIAICLVKYDKVFLSLYEQVGQKYKVPSMTQIQFANEKCIFGTDVIRRLQRLITQQLKVEIQMLDSQQLYELKRIITKVKKYFSPQEAQSLKKFISISFHVEKRMIKKSQILSLHRRLRCLGDQLMLRAEQKRSKYITDEQNSKGRRQQIYRDAEQYQKNIFDDHKINKKEDKRQSL